MNVQISEKMTTYCFGQRVRGELIEVGEGYGIIKHRTIKHREKPGISRDTTRFEYLPGIDAVMPMTRKSNGRRVMITDLKPQQP